MIDIHGFAPRRFRSENLVVSASGAMHFTPNLPLEGFELAR